MSLSLPEVKRLNAAQDAATLRRKRKQEQAEVEQQRVYAASHPYTAAGSPTRLLREEDSLRDERVSPENLSPMMKACGGRDRYHLLANICVDPRAFVTQAPVDLRNDLHFCSQVLDLDPALIEFCGAGVRGDREIMARVVARQGGLLKWASEELRDEDHIVLTACRSEARAFSFASDSLRGDREFILSAVKHKARVLLYADEEAVLRDRDFMLQAIAANEGALAFAPEFMRRDAAFMKIVNHGLG